MKIDNYRTWLKALKLIPGGNMLISKRPPNNLIKNIQFIFLVSRLLHLGFKWKKISRYVFNGSWYEYSWI